MPDPPKRGDKGGLSIDDLAPVSQIVVFERLLASLQEKVRPILEEIRAIKQARDQALDDQFLVEHRQKRAAARLAANQQSEASSATNSAKGTSGYGTAELPASQSKAAAPGLAADRTSKAGRQSSRNPRHPKQ